MIFHIQSPYCIILPIYQYLRITLKSTYRSTEIPILSLWALGSNKSGVLNCRYTKLFYRYNFCYTLHQIYTTTVCVISIGGGFPKSHVILDFSILEKQEQTLPLGTINITVILLYNYCLCDLISIAGGFPKSQCNFGFFYSRIARTDTSTQDNQHNSNFVKWWTSLWMICHFHFSTFWMESNGSSKSNKHPIAICIKLDQQTIIAH